MREVALVDHRVHDRALGAPSLSLAAQLRPVGRGEVLAHGDMLAGVDEPATDGIIERGGAAADPPPRLEHRHPTAPLDERRGSR